MNTESKLCLLTTLAKGRSRNLDVQAIFLATDKLNEGSKKYYSHFLNDL